VWKVNKVEALDGFGTFSEPFNVKAHRSMAFQVIIHRMESLYSKLLEMLWPVLEELVVRIFAENLSISWEIWFGFEVRAILIHSVVNLFYKLIMKYYIGGLILQSLLMILIIVTFDLSGPSAFKDQVEGDYQEFLEKEKIEFL